MHRGTEVDGSCFVQVAAAAGGELALTGTDGIEPASRASRMAWRSFCQWHGFLPLARLLEPQHVAVGDELSEPDRPGR